MIMLLILFSSLFFANVAADAAGMPGWQPDNQMGFDQGYQGPYGGTDYGMGGEQSDADMDMGGELLRMWSTPAGQAELRNQYDMIADMSGITDPAQREEFINNMLKETEEIVNNPEKFNQFQEVSQA